MDLKKLSAGAGTLFSRAKQYTEEKLGSADKTEYDATLQELFDHADKTKNWTEKIMRQMECYLQPNTASRVEDKMIEKLQGYTATRLMEADVLGALLVEAGKDLSSGAPTYGSALVKCGEAQQKLGELNRELIQAAVNNFLHPLQAFLDGDLKTLQKEKSTLETKRLDLDASKNKLKRVKPPSTEQDHEFAKAEAELNASQDEFDKQVEITKKVLESIKASHVENQRCLLAFIHAQAHFFAQAHKAMTDLQGNFAPASGPR